MHVCPGRVRSRGQEDRTFVVLKSVQYFLLLILGFIFLLALVFFAPEKPKWGFIVMLLICKQQQQKRTV